MSFFILNQFRKSFYPQKDGGRAEDFPELLLTVFLYKRSERKPVQLFYVIFYRIRQTDPALED